MRIDTLAFLLFLSHAVFGQEQLGLRLENYAGVNSLSLNPAGNLTNPLNWDINLAGGGLFFDNNYFYLKNTSTLDLYQRRHNIEFLPAEKVEGQPPWNTVVVDFFDDKSTRFISVLARVAGPSVAFKIRERHSFGIFTNVRFAAGSQNVPNPLSYYKYISQPFGVPFTLHPFDGATLAWAELGLNYAIKLPASNGYTGLGASLKILAGYEGGYIQEDGSLELTRYPGMMIGFDQPLAHYAFTTSNLKSGGYKPVRNGGGVALDLGFLHIIEGADDHYKLRLGASLMDIGYLQFRKNAQLHQLSVDSSIIVNLADYEMYTEPEQVNDIIRHFSQQTMGDSLATFKSSTFKMAMPAALSLQVDYAFTKHIYLNATLVQRLPTRNVTVPRNNLLALTPRLECRWFSASFPVALYNYQDIHFGIAARLGYLVIGSDNFTSLFRNANYTGSDIYVALKINPFDLHLGLFSGKDKRRFGGKRKVKCYDF